ncbi:MAG: D-aminoacylase [Betaproteobacteria bacterium]|nr:D-aminoacylase [Betaproteobacteria bacterium]
MALPFDLIIRGGTVIDGTRAPRFFADVALRGDVIAKIGDLAGVKARREIDATGLIVAPGFIDAHTHDDRLMLSAPAMAPKVSQGVTTVIAGNCGVSLAPVTFKKDSVVTPPLDLLDIEGVWFRYRSFSEYVRHLGSAPAATNAALLVGHTTLRVATMADVKRPATPAEITRMQSMVTEALEAGAIGVSTGLFYEPATAAPTEEVIEVCRPLKGFGGVYCTHMRNEGAGVMDSLEETFRIGREVGVQVIVSHHKVMGLPNHGRSRETLAFIERQMKAQSIGLDCYPYCASSTILSADRVATASKVLITWSKPHPEFSGMALDEIEQKMGKPRVEVISSLLPAGAIYFAMEEGDVQSILKFEHTMIGSDGLPHDSSPHPRLWGTFPRVLGHYSRVLGLFPLETAIYKMTGLTAKTFGLAGRGVILEGAFADIAMFDAETVGEATTFSQSIAPAHGIANVIVNGEIVWTAGQSTAARPGRVLRRT